MENTTRPTRQRVRVRKSSAPSVHRTATLPVRGWLLGAGLALVAAAVMYAGAARADEGVPGCNSVTPVVLAKRSAMSYAPHHRSIHRRGVLRTVAHEVGCTRESLPAAVAPLSVPAVEVDPAPVVVDAAQPVSMESPRAAVAAAAAGNPRVAVPLAMVAAGIAVCFVAGPCDGHSSSTGGHSVSTAGTTGTY